MLHGSSCVASDRQVLRALQGGHRQIRENDDATKASGARRQLQANLRDTNNTVKISWNCQTRMMLKQFLRRMIQRKKNQNRGDFTFKYACPDSERKVGTPLVRDFTRRTPAGTLTI